MALTSRPHPDDEFRDLFQQAEQAAQGEVRDDWVAVLEFAPGRGHGVDEMADLGLLLEALREWQPTALFNVDRYAIQLHVRAPDPVEALQVAFEGHQAATRAAGINAGCFLRSEILTVEEFESDFQSDRKAERPPPPSRGPAAVSIDVHEATRALISATTTTEVTAILVRYGASIGAQIHLGQIHLGAPVRADEVAVDFGFEDGPRITACAPAASPAGLLIQRSLPALLEDAHIARARIAALARNDDTPSSDAS